MSETLELWTYSSDHPSLESLGEFNPVLESIESMQCHCKSIDNYSKFDMSKCKGTQPTHHETKLLSSISTHATERSFY